MNASEPVPLLTVDNLHAAYVKKEILRGVSLTVSRGEIVALLGGNGSGKSTLLRTIAGLLHSMRGGIQFNGSEITAMSVLERQRLGVGYLLQGGRVFPNLTVAENIEVAMKHQHNVHRGRDLTPGAIFSVLKERAQVRAGLLSGGQRQMLAIEAVLAQEPSLALLDEPTAALSRDAVAQILAAVREFVARTSCGVLLVEQNVQEAKQITDRQLRLVDGRIDQS
jgi:branched-chain amino acid transport system ATP-binding protein